MQQRWLAAGMALGLAWCGMAHAQVDLSGLDDAMAGPRAQVLVLGSVHLGQMEGEFGPQAMEPLLAKLAAFAPDIITIEDISGEGCDLMARHQPVRQARHGMHQQQVGDTDRQHHQAKAPAQDAAHGVVASHGAHLPHLAERNPWRDAEQHAGPSRLFEFSCHGCLLPA